MKESATWYELHLTALLVVKDGHGGVDQMENGGLSNVELCLCLEAMLVSLPALKAILSIYMITL